MKRIRIGSIVALLMLLLCAAGTVQEHSFASEYSSADQNMPSADQNMPSVDEDIPGESEFEIVDGVLVKYSGSSAVVTVPDTVSIISSYAFSLNPSVRAVILPSSVVKVQNYAFLSCAALRYIVFPGNTSVVAGRAIQQCSRLTNIVAPKGSAAYRYASRKGIPVVTEQTPQFLKKKVILTPGETFKNILYSNIDPVVFKSSNDLVVSVSSAGKVRGRKTGKAVITAVAGDQKYRYTVVVKKKTVKNRIAQIASNTVTADMSRYEKVKAVHNWMIKNVKYDAKLFSWGYVPLISHTAKGAFVKGVAVCDGYSYAFQMVMKRLKIPCRFVVGTSGGIGHAWNMVKLGGKWYHVDVTFDDPIVNNSCNNKTPYYKYFLKSSSVMKKDHSWKVGNYPKCNSRKYN